MSAPRVATIVLNYNGKHLLAPCLDSLIGQTDSDGSILLVDNGSTDGSVQFAQSQYPQINILDNGENLYFAKGNNRGIEQALAEGADYVFILNNDTVVAPSCIALLTEFMESTPDAAGCQPLLVCTERPNKIASAGCRLAACGKGWDQYCGKPISQCPSTPFPVLGITGGAMFLRADAIREVGQFDPAFEMYLEDVDLSLRLRRAGFALYCVPNARVQHEMSATTDTLLGMQRRVFFCERNSYRLIIRNFPALHAAKAILLTLFFSVAAIASNCIRGNTKHATAIMRGMLSGLCSISNSLRSRQKIQAIGESNFWTLVSSDQLIPPNCAKRFKTDSQE